MSTDRIGDMADRLDGLYSDGCKAWNEALYEGWRLGDPGRVLAMVVFGTVLSPVLVAGMVRRLVKS